MRHGFALLALLAAAWTLGVWILDGFSTSFGGLQFSSSDPVRPFIVFLIAAAAYLASSGLARVRHDVATLRARLTPATLAALLALTVLAVGIANNSWGAGASDSYSYVSQMDLVLDGRLTVPVSLASEVPWPDALATFTPFGYSAVEGEAAIAPVTGSGLPLLMAAFKVFGGQTAAFVVVPLSGALLVWITFLLGRRVASDGIGLGAAWLVATSPTLLMMFKSQMSDVPAAAAWALATFWTLGQTKRSAALGGAAASIATLIRPNLAPIAAILFAWPILESRMKPLHERNVAYRRSIAFALTAIPGCLAVALINNRLFGSPFSSGYGELSTLFSAANVPATLASYVRWLVETQTPIVVAGVAITWIAPPLGLVLVAVWLLYAAYMTFEAWWFLRFLLPSWPAMFIGTTAAIARLFARFSPRATWGRLATAGVVFALGLHGLVVTAQQHVFTGTEGERRYATVAQLVAERTEPSAIVLASIHAGSLRYYAGRATLRFDLLHPDWLDRAATWLDQRGRHPYVLIEDWEMPAFRQRFGGRNKLGELQLTPMLAYSAYHMSGRTYLFDLVRFDVATVEPPPIRNPKPLCPGPAEPPEL